MLKDFRSPAEDGFLANDLARPHWCGSGQASTGQLEPGLRDPDPAQPLQAGRANGFLDRRFRFALRIVIIAHARNISLPRLTASGT